MEDLYGPLRFVKQWVSTVLEHKARPNLRRSRLTGREFARLYNSLPLKIAQRTRAEILKTVDTHCFAARDELAHNAKRKRRPRQRFFLTVVETLGFPNSRKFCFAE